MLGLKLNHVSKRGPWHFYFLKWKLTTDSWLVLKRNIHQQSMPPWQPFLKLLSWCPTRKSSYLNWSEDQAPVDGSSNELQRFDCMTGYHESSPSNGCLSRYQGCLMPWLFALPGHQQPWYWLCEIGKSWSFTRTDFNCRCHVSVEEW